MGCGQRANRQQPDGIGRPAKVFFFAISVRMAFDVADAYVCSCCHCDKAKHQSFKRKSIHGGPTMGHVPILVVSWLVPGPF